MRSAEHSLLLLSLVNASISFTVTESKLFRGFRAGLKARNSFFGDLFSCGYCFGHWSALILTAIYQPLVFRFWPPLDFVLTVLIIAWLSAFQWIAMCWLMLKTEK